MKYILPYNGRSLRSLTPIENNLLYRHGLTVNEILDWSIRSCAYIEAVQCSGTESSALVHENMEWLFEAFPDLTIDDWSLFVDLIYRVTQELTFPFQMLLTKHVEDDIGVVHNYSLDPVVEVFS